MARPKNAIPKTRVTVYLPEPLHTKVSLLMMNPLTGEIRYGALGALFETLLRKWVEEQQQATQETSPHD